MNARGFLADPATQHQAWSSGGGGWLDVVICYTRPMS